MAYPLIFLPLPALFNPSPIIALAFIKGELAEERAWEFLALSTVVLFFLLTAGLDGAGIGPEWFFHMYAAAAVHRFPVGTGAAQKTTS